MTDQTQNPVAGAGWLDTAWLVAAVVLLLAGLVGYYALGAATAMPLRVATVVGGLVLGVGAFARSAAGRALWTFAGASRVERRKMVWPTIPETRNVTLVVFLFVLLLGIFFWVVDWVLAWGTKSLLGGGA
jgi:preprotein translocase subunit SecE